MTEPSIQPQSSILIVDDTPANLQLLAGMLKESGYRVRPASTGSVALRAAGAERPDLILLDVDMPEMNGYEVCARLKADETLREIPVLFISALTETRDKIRAFEAGGVDYVTKPFQFQEVEARVRTHLELRQLQLTLQQQNRQLQESYDRLRELEQLRDNLVHMIVHDMRTPLMGINGFLQLAQMQELPATVRGHLTRCAASTDALVEMVSSLLDVSKMESGQMQLDLKAHSLRALTKKAVLRVESLKGQRSLAVEAPVEPLRLTCDGELIVRVVQNLLANAVKFTDENSGAIRVILESGPALVRASVRDNGPGIPEAYRATIFEKFGQVAARENKVKYSTGLGLTFCKLAVQAHGGEIGVTTEVGRGSTFWFWLPVRPRNAD